MTKMQKILLTASLTGALALPLAALAQQSGPSGGAAAVIPMPMEPVAAPEFLAAPSAGAVAATELTGADVYVAEGAPAETPVATIRKDWETAGAVSDLMINSEGRVEAVLIDVGGFLGLGEKTVALPISALDVVRDGDSDDWIVIFPGGRQMLDAAPHFEREKQRADARPLGAPAVTAEEG